MQSTLKIQRTSFVSLKTKCKPVEFGDPYSLQKIGVELCNLLVNTKYHSLSANQCGMTYSIFCCRVNNTFTTYFNPELIDIGRDGEYDMIEGKEVCQCFPSMQYTVKRPNGSWEPCHRKNNWLVGWLACCLAGWLPCWLAG